jgi:hypothetical protein
MPLNLRFVVSVPLVQRVSPNGLYLACHSIPPLLFVARLALPKWSPCSQLTGPLAPSRTATRWPLNV